MRDKYQKRMLKLRMNQLNKNIDNKWNEPIHLKGKLLNKYKKLINETNKALERRNIKYSGFEWTYSPKNESIMFLEVYRENRETFLKLELFELPELKDIVIEYRKESIKDMKILERKSKKK